MQRELYSAEANDIDSSRFSSPERPKWLKWGPRAVGVFGRGLLDWLRANASSSSRRETYSPNCHCGSMAVTSALAEGIRAHLRLFRAIGFSQNQPYGRIAQHDVNGHTPLSGHTTQLMAANTIQLNCPMSLSFTSADALENLLLLLVVVENSMR